MDWINAHGTEVLLVNYVFNSAVQALPSVDEHCGKVYRWIYGFLHAIAGNWKPTSKAISLPECPTDAGNQPK